MIALSAETAGRIIVILYSLGCVGAAATLLRRVRPDISVVGAIAIGWWFPFSFFYYMGFIPYLMAVPILFVFAGHIVAWIDRAFPSAVTVILVADLVLLYLCHPFGIALGVGVLALGLSVFAPDVASVLRTKPGMAGEATIKKRFLLRASWPLVVAIGSAGILLALAVAQNLSSVTNSVSSGGQATILAPNTWGDSARLIARTPMGPLHGSARTVQWLAITFLIAAIVVSLTRRRGFRPATIAKRVSLWFLLAAGTTAIGAFILAGLQSRGTVFHRLFIYPFMFLLLAWAVRASWGRLATVLIVCAAGFHVTAVLIGHLEFGREARPARELLAKIPPRSEVLPLLFNRDSAAIRDEYVHVYQHVTAYHAARTGGRYTHSPDHRPLPIRPRFSSADLPSLARPWSFHWNSSTREIPHVLLRSPQPAALQVQIMRQAFDRTISLLDSERQFLEQEDQWGLWGPRD
jgi:hypothetical protein